MSPSEGNDDVQSRLRALPSVDRVIQALGDAAPQPVVTAAARRAIDLGRHEIKKGTALSTEQIIERSRTLLTERERSLLHSTINATGVLLHTNLGRAPLGAEQIAAVSEVAAGYSNLEFELISGQRGSRYGHAANLLAELTGAESALVVNNNASAVLLVLAALCAGRNVVVSRGELIEIGGEFRVPDVMSASGAHLVEVGTTNRTHLSDYERAIGQETAALMKVHPSNYRVVGFTSSVRSRELAELAHSKGILFLHDLGSGLLGQAPESELTRAEPPVDVTLADGADLVTFSGDKLLGGPQAGIIVGRRDLIERLSSHPLMRALRVDKMTLAALQATLTMYLEGRAMDLPLWSMVAQDLDALEERAKTLTEKLSQTDAKVKVDAVPIPSVAGGGSVPGSELGSWGIAVRHTEKSVDELVRALRFGSTPVVGRIEDDRLLLDLRTVPDEADETLLELLRLAVEE